MEQMIFVNLPVADVGASRDFYTGLGFAVNEDFSDERCACLVVSSAIVVMLLDHERFADFVGDKEIVDAHRATGVINCLSAAGREEVDSLVAAAVAHGGVEGRVMEDGPMYGRSFADPDGHAWEVLHMEMAEVV